MHPHPTSPAPSLGLCFGLLLTVAAVSFFRDPTTYLLPPLAYEDGRDMFAYFYNHREAGAILRSYNGYVSLLPNLVGYAALLLPTRWAPHALALVPLLFASLAFSWLYLPTYRYLIPADSVRLATCVVLALAPVANSFFIANTTYSSWSLLLWLVWLSLAPPPERPAAALGRLVVMSVLIWTHPLSIALIPVYLVAMACHRHHRTPRLFYAALGTAAILYQLFGVEARQVSLPGAVALFHHTAVFLLERVVFATTFGDAAAAFLRRVGAPALIPVGALAVLLAATTLAVRHRRRFGRGQGAALATLIYLAVAFTVLYVVGRSPSLDILEAGRAFRYFWVQRLLWIVALALVAAAVSRGWRAAPRPRRAVFLMLLGVVYLSILNFNNNGPYRSRARLGHRVAEFTAEVARQEATGDGSVEARLERGVWSLELHREGRSRSTRETEGGRR